MEPHSIAIAPDLRPKISRQLTQRGRHVIKELSGPHHFHYVALTLRPSQLRQSPPPSNLRRMGVTIHCCRAMTMLPLGWDTK